jgi:SAM-dependent methyltransferase
MQKKSSDITEPKQFSLPIYYWASARVGIGCIARGDQRIEGIKRILNPLSFPRPAEFREALYSLAPTEGTRRVLDVGSPKLPVIVLLKERPDLEIFATDIVPDFVEPIAAFLRAANLGDRLGKTIHLMKEDARRLSFEDDFFDWVYSISVLEHVADEDGTPGDSEAIREIARVLRPGGVVTLTVPFDANGFHEEYVEGDVYERAASNGQGTFYQRHYDAAAVQERLIGPSGLECEEMVYLGEKGRWKVEPWWNRIPMKAKVPLLPFQGAAGNVLFSRVPPEDLSDAKGVALRLRKS